MKNQQITEMIEKALETEVSPSRRLITAIFFSVFCLSPLLLLIYLFSPEAAHLIKSLLRFWPLTLTWMICELIVIWWLYASRHVPIIVRNSIYIIIGSSTTWFLLLAMGGANG